MHAARHLSSAGNFAGIAVMRPNSPGFREIIASPRISRGGEGEEDSFPGFDERKTSAACAPKSSPGCLLYETVYCSWRESTAEDPFDLSPLSPRIFGAVHRWNLIGHWTALYGEGIMYPD
ncbi:hypothetical protein KM043_006421 [Ampulex compressa]|nr:hypothetical protein KM043_006421 [Ampulex compressa]